MSETYTTRSQYSNRWTSVSRFTDSSSGQDLNSSVSGTQFSAANTTSGERNPKWRDQIRDGINATTPFTGVENSGSGSWHTAIVRYAIAPNNAPQNIWTRTFEMYGYPRYPAFPILGSVPGSTVTRVTNRCIAQFLDSCENARSSFEAGQDLGEYKETVHSIRQPLHSLRNKLLEYITLLTKAKRSYKSDKVSLRKALADTYLEWRFGINPLVSDVASAIADAGRHRFRTVDVRGSAKEDYAGSNDLVQPAEVGFLGPLNPRLPLKSNSKYSVRYKGAIRTGCDASGRIGLAQSWQLLPRDWLPTAWDLIPYSWIADYFTNVGDMIRALSFVSSDLVWACKTVRQEVRNDYGNMVLTTPLTPPTNYHVVDQTLFTSGGSASLVTKQVTRAVLTSTDLMPRFQFRIPQSKYPYYNLAALVLSRATKLVPFF